MAKARPCRSRRAGPTSEYREFRLQKEKIRIYSLARELGLESAELVNLCRQAGFDVKNQLSSVDPEQREAIVKLVQQGSAPAAQSGRPHGPPVLPPPPKEIKNIPASRGKQPVVRPPVEAPSTSRTPPPAGPTPPAGTVVPHPEKPTTTVPTATA